MNYKNLPLLLLLVLASCNGDHPLVDPSVSGRDAIAFGSSIAEQEQQTTRAVGLQTLHSAFHVWSYKALSGGMQSVIADYTVGYTVGSAGTTETNTADWDYVGVLPGQEVKYWDYAATSYRFWGYAGDGVNVSADGTTLTFPGLALSTTEPTTALYSSLKEVEKSGYGQTVQLEFRRPYAKIRVAFYCAEPLDVDDEVTITGITFAPTEGSIPRQGSMEILYPLTGPSTWSVTPGALTQDDLSYLDVTLTSTIGTSSDHALTAKPNAEAEFYYVLPTSSGNPSFQLKADVNEEPKTAVVPANFMQWKPNFFYTYIFKITEAGRKLEFFDVRVTPWLYGGSLEDEWRNW